MIMEVTGFRGNVKFKPGKKYNKKDSRIGGESKERKIPILISYVHSDADTYGYGHTVIYSDHYPLYPSDINDVCDMLIDATKLSYICILNMIPLEQEHKSFFRRK